MLTLDPTCLLISFVSLYRVDALIVTLEIGDLFYFRLCFRILLNLV